MGEDENTETSPKPKTKKKMDLWYVRVLLVLGPVLISSYFSYCNARVDAEAKARSISGKVEGKAEAGYQEIIYGLKHLDEEAKAIRMYIGRLESRLDEMEARAGLRMRVPRPNTDGENPPDSAGSAASPATHEPIASQPLNIAPSLDQAASKHGADL